MSGSLAFVFFFRRRPRWWCDSDSVYSTAARERSGGGHDYEGESLKFYRMARDHRQFGVGRTRKSRAYYK